MKKLKIFIIFILPLIAFFVFYMLYKNNKKFNTEKNYNENANKNRKPRIQIQRAEQIEETMQQMREETPEAIERYKEGNKGI